MDALVVYESMFGNSRRVARAIADGLGTRVEVRVVEVGSAPTVIDVALLVVGGPNHRFGLSSASSRAEAAGSTDEPLASVGTGLREWLAELPRRYDVLACPKAAVYDTQLTEPAFLRRVDRAGRSIHRRLRRLGYDMTGPPMHFLVSEAQGPLVDGELARARRWGEELADLAADIGLRRHG